MISCLAYVSTLKMEAKLQLTFNGLLSQVRRGWKTTGGKEEFSSTGLV
jgi:hypothetical protein